jgi:hypothetical protein
MNHTEIVSLYNRAKHLLVFKLGLGRFLLRQIYAIKAPLYTCFYLLTPIRVPSYSFQPFSCVCSTRFLTTPDSFYHSLATAFVCRPSLQTSCDCLTFAPTPTAATLTGILFSSSHTLIAHHPALLS